MPTISTAKLIGGLVGLLAVIAFVLTAFHWKGQRDDLRDWQGQVISATVDAAGLKDKNGNPAKMKPKDVPQQIRFLGEALDAVRTKTAQAKADDLEHARTVETHQTQVGQETSNDYQAAIARVRADYAERLRVIERQASTNSGSGGTTRVPSTPASSIRPDAAAAQNGLPSEDALTATEQAIQLKAIQDFACKTGLAKSVKGCAQ